MHHILLAALAAPPWSIFWTRSCSLTAYAVPHIIRDGKAALHARRKRLQGLREGC